MKPFTKRLRAAKKSAALTTKEMAVWFGNMSDQTMWTWLSGRIPKEYHEKQAYDNLAALEKEIARKGSSLPLPLSVNQGDRQRHVADIRKRYA